MKVRDSERSSPNRTVTSSNLLDPAMLPMQAWQGGFALRSCPLAHGGVVPTEPHSPREATSPSYQWFGGETVSGTGRRAVRLPEMQQGELRLSSSFTQGHPSL